MKRIILTLIIALIMSLSFNTTSFAQDSNPINQLSQMKFSYEQKQMIHTTGKGVLYNIIDEFEKTEIINKNRALVDYINIYAEDNPDQLIFVTGLLFDVYISICKDENKHFTYNGLILFINDVIVNHKTMLTEIEKSCYR